MTPSPRPCAVGGLVDVLNDPAVVRRCDATTRGRVLPAEVTEALSEITVDRIREQIASGLPAPPQPDGHSTLTDASA